MVSYHNVDDSFCYSESPDGSICRCWFVNDIKMYSMKSTSNYDTFSHVNKYEFSILLFVT